MLGLAKRLNIPIFQESTSEIYGDPLVHPQTEDYWGHVNPIEPRACCDEGKCMAVGDGRGVSNFIVQALQGKNITIFGDGLQTRSFCYVSDLIDGFVKMMDQEMDLVGPINLGNPIEVTMLELAEIVLQKTKSSSKLDFRPLPEDDPRQRQPDISKASNSLNWAPSLDLADGLDSTVD